MKRRSTVCVVLNAVEMVLRSYLRSFVLLELRLRFYVCRITSANIGSALKPQKGIEKIYPPTSDGVVETLCNALRG
ncbi:hypothetical protein SAMN04488518_102465 [Pseudovibrio ascidiaceicola]|uniref:Secreted protein n=1 Tax=Pseudovibrio ascidiaceicola TaxID=285279 RepID=A0A1I3XAI8_9HYPH|nr:hypothetical protein PsAD26_01322 [Pseudovibrio sp. Ad26]SFK16387.1 hypothetical protein SAMN04488518_102465 [Pseudovibrio ascidiaceicola]